MLGREYSGMAVSNTKEFLDWLRTASEGDICGVEEHSLINLSKYKPDDIKNTPRNIKIIADGSDSRPSATFHYYPKDRVSGMLLKSYGNIELSGFNVYGPEPRPIPYDKNYELGFIWGLGDEMVVENCYFYGWPFAAVASGSMRRQTDIVFRESKVRNCWMQGLGYAVEHYNGYGTFENLDIDNCRHGIAGFGWPTCSYEVKKTRFGPHFLSHQIDMHRASESAGQSSLDEMGTDEWDAGGDLDCHHNIFEMTHDWNEEPQEAVAIRGIPTGQVDIHKNLFFHEDPRPHEPGGHGTAVRQQGVDEWTNVNIADDNEWEVDFPLVDGSSSGDGSGNGSGDEEPVVQDPLTKEEMLQMLSGEQIGITGTVEFQ